MTERDGRAISAVIKKDISYYGLASCVQRSDHEIKYGIKGRREKREKQADTEDCRKK